MLYNEKTVLFVVHLMFITHCTKISEVEYQGRFDS